MGIGGETVEEEVDGISMDWKTWKDAGVCW